MRFVAFLATLAALGLAGCASDKLIGRPDMQIVAGDALPPPTRNDGASQLRPYVIGPLDKLDVDVFGITELTKSVQVDSMGDISFPLVGTLKVAGKTPIEVAHQLEGALRGQYVRNPRVTVNATASNQVVTVDGAVKEPGLYPMIGGMTLIRALASAKGVSEFADTNYVVVFRRVNGREMAALYDLRAIRQGMYADPPVYANDTITVGESAGRRAFQTLIQGSGLIVTPLVALLN